MIDRSCLVRPGSLVQGIHIYRTILYYFNFLRDVKRFSCPYLVTGFRKRQNPVTRYGRLGQF